MTSDDLIADITKAEADMTWWKSAHDSPGYQHQLELLNLFKSHEDWQAALCDLIHWDRAKLNEYLAFVGQMIALGDQVAANTPARVTLLEAVKRRDFLLKTIARVLSTKEGEEE